MARCTEQFLLGQPAAGGIAKGVLRVLAPESMDDMSFRAGEDLSTALERARRELTRLIEREQGTAGDILEFQLALLEDEDFLQPVRIREREGHSWQEAWREVLDAEITAYRDSGDEFLAARADDLKDLRQRVLGTGMVLSDIGDDAILAAVDLTPSQFLQAYAEGVSGIALSSGSATGHVAILARERGISMVVGLAADMEQLPDEAPAVLDGEEGRLIIYPEEQTLTICTQRLRILEEEEQIAQTVATLPAKTADGVPIKVMLNAANPDDLERYSPGICDGIGLVRTEFLFSGEALPDEDAQTQAYERLLAWAEGRPVTIRTLDAGGDKPIAGVTVDGEANPFLGLRGLRLSLHRPELFRIQLRALLRAAVHGNLKVMLPMVSVPEEIALAHEQLKLAQKELKGRNIPFGQVSLGMMVEVPAAALMAEHFDVEFYSIGSNDLIQYTMATERGNAAVFHLADGRNLAIMELIARTAQAGRRLGREVSLCGTLASEPEHVGRLLDAGLRTLSVEPAMVGRVKLAISRHVINREKVEQ